MNVVAGIAGDRWSMLYMTAASLSASVVEILITIRSSRLPLRGLYRALPGAGYILGDYALPDRTARAIIDSISFFMDDLLKKDSIQPHDSSIFALFYAGLAFEQRALPLQSPPVSA